MRVYLLVITLFFSLFVVDNYAQSSAFVAEDCDYAIDAFVDMTCGTLVVPLDYANPDKQTIEIAVVILHHPDGNPEPDPIIYLEGGPGGTTLRNLDISFRSRFEPLFATNRDVIVFDQRGIGLSTPALDCPEYHQALTDTIDLNIDGVDISETDGDRLILDGLKACGERLSSKMDLALFNSANSARDIESLRVALGYEQVNLWGISYGTRLALTAMRDAPDSIRSVVLDSVYPPNSNLFTEVALTRDSALNGLFAACLVDSACNNTYPELEAVFYATVDILNANPIRINTIDSVSGNVYSNVHLDGDDFLIITLSLMYQTDILPVLPQLIYQMHTGNYGLYAIFAGGVFGQQEAISIGKYYAVQCHEEASFSTLEAITESYINLPQLERIGSTGYGVGAVLDVCEAFISSSVDALEDDAVTSDIPTLVLAGQLDPITPPDWAQRSVETLSNSTYIEFPYHGHGISAGEGCGLDLVIAYIQSPNDVLDTSCVDDITINFRGVTVPLDNQANTAPMLIGY